MTDIENQYRYVDDDSQKLIQGSLGDPRQGLVRKVCGIVSVQLLITVIFTSISLGSESFQKFQSENYGILIAAAVLTFVIMIMIACFKKISRTVPVNYICLIIFTLCESYIVSAVCSSVGEPKIVFMAAAMTMGITFAITVYALTTKTDFTMLGATLFIFSTALLLFGIFMWAFSAWNKPLYILYCILGVIVYGYYLAYDVQLIKGGQDRYELDIDDYIIGALMVYIDIIIIFLKILQILAILFKK